MPRQNTPRIFARSCMSFTVSFPFSAPYGTKSQLAGLRGNPLPRKPAARKNRCFSKGFQRGWADPRADALRLTAREMLATPQTASWSFQGSPSATPDTATQIKTVWVGTVVPASEPVKDNTHSVIVQSIEVGLQKSIFSSLTALFPILK